jgi:hypothetical protein
MMAAASFDYSPEGKNPCVSRERAAWLDCTLLLAQPLD